MPSKDKFHQQLPMRMLVLITKAQAEGMRPVLKFIKNTVDETEYAVELSLYESEYSSYELGKISTIHNDEWDVDSLERSVEQVAEEHREEKRKFALKQQAIKIAKETLTPEQFNALGLE